MPVCGLLSALVFVVATLPSIAQSDEMKDVSCNSFDIGYDGQAATKKCFELHQYGNQTEVKIKRLIAEDTSYEMIVTYSAGLFRTYFPIRPLREQIEGANYFSDTDNWLATKQYAGFEIAVFEGFAKAGDPAALCAAFSRYTGVESGAYEFEGAPVIAIMQSASIVHSPARPHY
jgi:hypothetical protein